MFEFNMLTNQYKMVIMLAFATDALVKVNEVDSFTFIFDGPESYEKGMQVLDELVKQMLGS